MIIKLVYGKDTRNYVYYETVNSDFRYPFQIAVRMWIPKDEIEIDIPGVYPGEISIEIKDDSSTFHTPAPLLPNIPQFQPGTSVDIPTDDDIPF